VLFLGARCFCSALSEAPTRDTKIQIETVRAELQFSHALIPAPPDSLRRVGSGIRLVADGRFLRDHSRTTAGLPRDGA
jgi:hypothetical protein